MKTIQLKQCYRCRRLFHSSDPAAKYCKECQRELRKRRYTSGPDTRTLLGYAGGIFAGLFIYNLGHPIARLVGLAIIVYIGSMMWRRLVR